MRLDTGDSGKQTFDIKVVLRRIRKAVEPFPKAGAFSTCQ